MERRAQIYEGKAKILYETDDPDLLIQYFKDDATAFNAAKRGTIVGKGVMNNRISATLLAHVAEHGVPTHFVKVLSDREMLVKRLQIIKIEVVVRNIVAGSLAKRLGLPEGQALAEPVLEF
ncbi:MAG: phosphoribosylaminoimidazolesuccinocarboxamide synthase, partial [candidate division NC10 bacterium]|nr:phosphoribosylaminoimidazolesuccinocarboxamide synthase [candidate division NC10 bacterium]